MPGTRKRNQPSIARRKQDVAFAFTLRLPPDLATELAAIASAEGRSRAKQIEVALRQFVQSYRREAAA
jgi:predicted transcriptional regulator